ncbi:hypothetical protein DFP95_10418 [Cohnella lupini]|uniref:Uncharacterized protein n=1 Tax=Cohnella lupini TaxID=1294267 RepID=A0A3D9IMT1_9BACL|nr:hypothetical protein DFP95_10418 [Cohnella lupini]
MGNCYQVTKTMLTEVFMLNKQKQEKRVAIILAIMSLILISGGVAKL